MLKFPPSVWEPSGNVLGATVLYVHRQVEGYDKENRIQTAMEIEEVVEARRRRVEKGYFVGNSREEVTYIRNLREQAELDCARQNKDFDEDAFYAEVTREYHERGVKSKPLAPRPPVTEENIHQEAV